MSGLRSRLLRALLIVVITFVGFFLFYTFVLNQPTAPWGSIALHTIILLILALGLVRWRVFQAILVLDLAAIMLFDFLFGIPVWDMFTNPVTLYTITALIFLMGLARLVFFRAVLMFVVATFTFRYFLQPPTPWSVISLYVAIVLMAVLVYISSNSDSWREFLLPIHDTLTKPERRSVRLGLVVAIPLLLGYYAYTQAAAKPQAPPELRAVHPAPPDAIQFRGKDFKIAGADNPLRKDAAGIPKHVAAGGETYIRNCMYCHGDNLDGKGHFAHGFNPPPANFVDPGTIAMLQEAYLFWRIAKGGPGLPREATPWNSVMPAWEDRLTEEQIWQVIMYLYDATGQQPRRWESH